MDIKKHPRPVFAGPTPASILDPVLDEDTVTSVRPREFDGWLARVLRRLLG
jgi:hypothetical protein